MPTAYVCSLGLVYDDGVSTFGGPYQVWAWEDTDDADLVAFLAAKAAPFYDDFEVDRSSGVVLRWQRYLLAVDPDTGEPTHEPYGDPGEATLTTGDYITHRLRDVVSSTAAQVPGVLDLGATGHWLADRFGRPLTLADMSGTDVPPPDPEDPEIRYVTGTVTVTGAHAGSTTSDHTVTWDVAATSVPYDIAVGPGSNPFWASRMSGALLGSATTTGCTIRVSYSAPVAISEPPVTMPVTGTYLHTP